MSKKKKATKTIKEDLPQPIFKPPEPDYKKELRDFKKTVLEYLQSPPSIPAPEMSRFLVWAEPLKKLCSR